jgi:PAS domain S-box-containing protein
VSGSIGEIMAIELLKKGAVDYVLKDRLERLPFAVKRALEEAKERREKKAVELSLQKSEEKYRNIFENVQDVFFQTDLNGKILEVSPSIKYYTSFSRKELIGASVIDLYYDISEREKLLGKILKKGEVTDFELRLRNVDNGVVYTSVNARLIFNEDGLPDHIDGSIRDITERKKSEERIRKSETDLNYAQQIARMGSWTYNVVTNSYKWSKNMYKLLGLDLSKVNPSFELFNSLVHPDDRKMIDEFHQKIIDTRGPVSFDFRYLLNDGSTLWVQNNISPVFHKGKLIEMNGVNIDITEKKYSEQELIKEKEKAEASDRLKTAFLNNISHEIRTPLNSILGFSQIITDPGLTDADREKYYVRLTESSDRLLNTMTNIMDMSILTSGNQRVLMKDVRLKELLETSIYRFADACWTKNIRLTLENTFPPAEFILKGDEELLGKVLHQLLDNAVKFTEHGYIKVMCLKIDDEIQFAVEDTGIGISDVNTKRIMANFMQEDTENTRRKYDGTGVGLSIAKHLVELMGGRLWLESEKGAGSTFYFTHPIF